MRRSAVYHRKCHYSSIPRLQSPSIFAISFDTLRCTIDVSDIRSQYSPWSYLHRMSIADLSHVFVHGTYLNTTLRTYIYRPMRRSIPFHLSKFSFDYIFHIFQFFISVQFIFDSFLSIPFLFHSQFAAHVVVVDFLIYLMYLTVETRDCSPFPSPFRFRSRPSYLSSYCVSVHIDIV